MEGIELKVKRLHPDAHLPTYGSDGAACFDLYAVASYGPIEINPGDSEPVNTGLAFEVPPGWVLKVYSRSGHGFKNGVRLVNSVGIIDSDYRGELVIGLRNDLEYTIFTVNDGDRIAQAMLVPVPHVAFHEVDELSTTTRGTGGFGSTGN